ncbi:DarT ssDNA thymidine ADP-ribosyltransferase family protein [Oceanimonas sp. MB9]|uniref:DarT ssDNA thymidine ADP-ribosyltransferase family protein n=1 Tax=Oceanimonas sp. MB9 TaxID=2588453 RepID=UPI0013F67607|nr:DarT ssDNA thymidine ADP-ribosyltransferase family protein [Oceanimonas sp. MB9]NHI00817.1 hypothetical protein [Oceanimonas sp. MB9]
MSNEIESYAKELKVPCLLHFTQLSNLESILTEGLLSRDRIAGLANSPAINDELRLDNHTNTISLSIAHPNSQMFYKYRMEKGGDWCVIGIHPRVLWSQDSLFCKHNAADARISGIPISDLAGISAFRGMYDEIPGHESRSDQCLKAYDPTDVQAEVLVIDSIDLSNFIGVVFPSRQAKKNYSELFGDMQAKIHAENKGYYAARSYKRKYQ